MIIILEKKFENIHEYIIIGTLLLAPFILFYILPGKYMNNMMGIISGFLIGAYMAKDRIIFNPKNQFLPNIYKILIGLSGLFLFRVGVKFILPDLPISGFFRYWIMGFWISFFAPLIFSKIELLKGEKL